MSGSLSLSPRDVNDLDLGPGGAAGGVLPDGESAATDGQGVRGAAGPGARVAVPAGSGGSDSQADPAPVVIWPRFAVVMIAAVAPGPNDAEVRAPPWSGPADSAASYGPPG